jgi:hypothetical protein
MTQFDQTLFGCRSQKDFYNAAILKEEYQASINRTCYQSLIRDGIIYILGVHIL